MANGKKKSKKKIYIFSAIGVVIVALILMALLGGSKENIIPVQVEKVVKRNITQTVSATGTIDSEFKVGITPEVTGEIVKLPVKEGDKVTKGQMLIQINAKQYEADKESAEANLQAAKSTAAMRKAELDNVQSDYERTKELYNKNLSSDAEFQAAKSSYESSKASYQGAMANVSQSEAALRRSEDQLSKTTILSPMDGTVTKLNVELGERVLGSFYSQGTDIMTVSDLNNMEAIADVDENDVVLVTIGDTARIKVDAFGDKVFKGLVKEIGNSAISTGTGTQEQVVNFEVKIKLTDLDPKLRPGMSCNADIETETKDNVISVPIQSVTARTNLKGPGENNTSDNGNEDNPNQNAKKTTTEKIKEIVFVVKNNKAKAVEVETGISNNNYIEVMSGLSGGEEVVSGSYRAISRELSNDANVRIESGSKEFGQKQ
ncbi:MAG: efflux RND transporter periplasmic adaptor subunit [Ignavibacteriaceae bacterium]